MHLYKNNKYLFPTKREIRQRYSMFLILIFFVLVSIAFLSGYFIFSKEGTMVEKEFFPSSNVQEKENKFYRILDGAEVKNKEDQNPNLIAVVVDNFIESRPLSGLSKAKLVYEALTEAGITRFLAIYPLDELEDIRKIGPIRSARPYFLDLAEEYKLLFMHVGGSPDAINLLKEKKHNLYNLDQFFNAQYFWREKTRKAPFNVYTSSDLFKRALWDKKMQNNIIESWEFKDDLKMEDRPEGNKNIIIDYSYPEYKIEWKYNREANNYSRIEGGKIYIEEEERQIAAKNVIIQVAKTEILDEEGRIEVKTIGEGESFILQDGKIVEGLWQKFRKDERTKFFDQNNQEIKFNRGATWIEIVPNKQIVSY